MANSFPKKFMLFSSAFFILLIALISFKNIKVGHILKNIKQPASIVNVLKIEKLQDWPLIVEQPGSIKARHDVSISALIQGHIKTVHVKPGQIVAENQLLVSLDDQLYRALRDKAEAAFNLASLNLKRDEKLFYEKTISTASYQKTLSTYHQAKAEFEHASIQLKYHHIRAPFAGMVDYFDLDPGSYVQVGQSLLQLYTQPPHDVEFTLPQEYFNSIKINQPLSVSINNQDVVGHVVSFGTGVSTTSRRFFLRAALSEGAGHHPGDYVKVKIPFKDDHQYLVVPNSIIDYTALGPVVWVFTADLNDPNQGTVSPVIIQPSRMQGDYVAIQGEGLIPPLTFVSRGQLMLRPGAKVVVHG